MIFDIVAIQYNFRDKRDFVSGGAAAGVAGTNKLAVKADMV